MDLTDFLRQCINMSGVTQNPAIIPKIRLHDSSPTLWPITQVFTEKTKKGKAIKNYIDLDGMGGRLELPIPRDSINFDDMFLNFVVKNSLQLPELITEMDPRSGELLYYMEIEYKQLREPPTLIGSLYKTKRGKIRPVISIKHDVKGIIINNKIIDDNPLLVYYFINYSKV